MANTIFPLLLSAPGFYGLNTSQIVQSDLHWASKATNAVIDSAGRLAARKGRKNVTATAITGTPEVAAIFEQIRSDGTKTILSAAGNKLYSGTATLTDITGTAGGVTGITANHWQFQNTANKCVGFQDGHDPIVRTTGNFSLLQQDLTSWAAATAYAVGAVRKSTAGNQTIYFHCTTAGTSAGAEPAWNTTVGGATTDNTVTWTTRKFPNGNVCHSAFGRIWVTSNGDASVVEFSDTLLPHVFRGGAAGTLDLKQVWGGDQVSAIASIEDYLVIFGRRHVLIYAGPEDPATMTLAEKIEGVGCVGRDTVVSAGNDMVFVSASGVRLLSRAIEAGGRQALGDLSINVRAAFLNDVNAELAANMKAVYHEGDGFYVVSLSADEKEWVFDIRFPNQDGSAKVTTWNGFESKSFYSASDGTLYVGHDGRLCKYDGYNDGATGTYIMDYESSWSDLAGLAPVAGIAARLKVPKRWRSRVVANANYGITWKWGFDFNESLRTDARALGLATTGAEWNEAEWGSGEFSGGDAFAAPRSATGGHGTHFKLGWALTVNGSFFAVQSLDVGFVLGRVE